MPVRAGIVSNKKEHSFTKYDVYEEISTNRTEADHVMLRQLANTAAAKIR